MIDLAIVGAGAMGANHARVAMGVRDANLTAIVDPDPIRGKAVAHDAGCEYLPDVAGVADVADAVVLAVPTDLHYSMGIELLNRGVSTLIEKPIAHDLGQAEQLVEAAARSGAVLMVGHVERFNPAVMEIGLHLEQPIHIESARIGPYSSRIPQGVILDLMIHDLDIVAALADSPVAAIEAFGTRVRSGTEDLAVALLGFENGVTATLTASRLGQQKIRRMTVTAVDAFIEVDMLRRDVTINRVEEITTDGRGPGIRQRGIVEIPVLQNHGEPLWLELQHFVECVQSGARPLVSGEDGHRALDLALAVMKAASLERP